MKEWVPFKVRFLSFYSSCKYSLRTCSSWLSLPCPFLKEKSCNPVKNAITTDFWDTPHLPHFWTGLGGSHSSPLKALQTNPTVRDNLAIPPNTKGKSEATPEFQSRRQDLATRNAELAARWRCPLRRRTLRNDSSNRRPIQISKPGHHPSSPIPQNPQGHIRHIDSQPGNYILISPRP